MPEDRPSDEEIENDKLLDDWLVRFEREQATQASFRKAEKLKRKNADAKQKSRRNLA